MTLAAGTRLGPYVILAPLRAAWVRCTARDTRLERTVAIQDPGAQTVLRALVPD